METILDGFYDVAILLCIIEKLNMSEQDLMDCVLECFWCKFEMTFSILLYSL